MRTLRAQVTALLVVAMLVVIALANGASFFLAGPPWPHFAAAEPLASILDLAQAAPGYVSFAGAPGGHEAAPATGIRPEPPAGEILEEETRRLAADLARLGKPFPVRVVMAEGGGPFLTAVRLPDGRWLVLQGTRGMMPPPPGPPGGPFGLATWLAFLVAGVTLVVFFAVRRLTKPLSLIEEAVGRIGADGQLPVLPEQGAKEVRAAAAAINRLSARLKSVMDSRMRIVAGAAHDLRTPLTRMRLRAEFIADEEERTQWLADLAELDRIADSAIRLVREEVEGGPEERVRFDRLVTEVAAELAEATHKVTLLEVQPATVSGRSLSLKRAVRNLVVNAATHGGGARIALHAQGGTVVLMIEDDGPGIPEALMGRVFEPFFRVDPGRKVIIPGAGLGLAIAHEIIGRHRGRLTLANRPGGGLLQRVELPAAGEESTQDTLSAIRAK
ncbi:ATP-binding protein [Xanthobacter sp. AM11]|uniref:ATP-binding protein n=1 Tax=Xanthobacter sp. AM11 TaxID=3380643 RepID=UPI0039BFCDDD